MVNPLNSYWEFDGSTDSLTLPGTDTEAAIFDPNSNNDDFTVAGFIAPGTVSKNFHSVFSKWDADASKRSWQIQAEFDDIAFIVSDDGSNTSKITKTSVLTVDTNTFFCGRYEYNGAGTINNMYFYVDGSESSISNSRGPIYSGNGDVKIADLVFTGDRYYDGRIYWLAYWNRKLSDDDVQALRDGVDPANLVPDGYINFIRNVGTTYDLEIPTDGSAQFDVNGTPTSGATKVQGHIFNVYRVVGVVGSVDQTDKLVNVSHIDPVVNYIDDIAKVCGVDDISNHRHVSTQSISTTGETDAIGAGTVNISNHRHVSTQSISTTGEADAIEAGTVNISRRKRNK